MSLKLSVDGRSVEIQLQLYFNDEYPAGSTRRVEKRECYSPNPYGECLEPRYYAIQEMDVPCQLKIKGDLKDIEQALARLSGVLGSLFSDRSPRIKEEEGKAAFILRDRIHMECRYESWHDPIALEKEQTIRKIFPPLVTAMAILGVPSSDIETYISGVCKEAEAKIEQIEAIWHMEEASLRPSQPLRVEAVAEAIQKGSRLDLKNGAGENLLHRLAKLRENQGVLKFLLEHHAKPSKYLDGNLLA